MHLAQRNYIIGSCSKFHFIGIINFAVCSCFTNTENISGTLKIFQQVSSSFFPPSLNPKAGVALTVETAWSAHSLKKDELTPNGESLLFSYL